MTKPADVVDVAAYLKRIGYAGEPRADLDTLRGIVLAHSQTIPFENLDPFLGRPVELDAKSLQDKLITDRRGGYCFEQNLLLRHALDAIGFETTGLAARVIWQRDPAAPMPARGHMLLRVAIDGTPYVVDVGFGGMTLTGVLELNRREAQETPHEPFRIAPVGSDLLMQGYVAGEWKSTYRFDLQQQYQADYEVTSWYLSHNPASHFVTGLMVARPTPTGRLALSGRHLAVHHLDGPSEHIDLTTPEAIVTTLQEKFQIDVSHLDDLTDRLAQRFFD